MRISTIILAAVIFFFGGILTIYGQNCYEVIADKSGMDIAPYQAELEAAACELIQTFPEEFQDSFKVYSFGFYSQHESMDYGFNAVWEKVISDIESPYYLIFGKQTDKNGVYTKFWVRLKLPTSNEFSCFDSDYYNKIEFKVAQKTKSIHVLNQNSFNTFSEAEIGGIQELNDWIIKIIECCDLELRNDFSCNICAWTTEESFEFFTLEDFDQDSILIIDNLPIIDSLCLCSTEYNPTIDIREGISYEVVKSTMISEIYFQEDTMDLGFIFDELEEIASVYEQNNFKFYGVISDNSTFCSNTDETSARSSTNLTFEEIGISFNSSQIGIWIHIQYDNSVATLNVKTKGIGGNVLKDCKEFPQYCGQLTSVIKKLESNSKSLFYEITKSFYTQNELDLVIRVGGVEYPGASGTTTRLDSVLKYRIVTCSVDEFYFSNNQYCTSKLGYLKVAEIILHECVHAFLTRLVAKQPGKNGHEKSLNYKGFNYNAIYSHYYHKLSENNKGWTTNFTEHYILFNNFFRKITKSLYLYNGNYGKEYNYFWIAYTFLARDEILSDMQAVLGYNSNTTIQSIRADMELKYEYLKEKPIPCLD